jgi:hypothetical protein
MAIKKIKSSLLIKFGKSKKSDHLVSFFGLSGFSNFRTGRRHELHLRFKNSKSFEAWKKAKKHQGTKIEENQAKS